MSLPLAGKRFVVTRARRQADRLKEALDACGAAVILLPAIEVAPPLSLEALDAALARLDTFGWLVLSSANTVDALSSRAKILSVDLTRARCNVAVIGPATARAAEGIGLRVDLMPERHVAESLAAELQSRVRGQRVFYPRAEQARDVIPSELRAAGAEVTAADAYRTILPEASLAKLRALMVPSMPPPDGVLFTSSSTVKNFLSLLEAAAIPSPPPWPAISIGPITSATLREHRWAPAAEAREATIPALVEACIPPS